MLTFLFYISLYKALDQAPRHVEIIINPENIDIVEASTHISIKAVPIMDVSFTAFDPEDRHLFSYITNDSRLGLIYCHAFSVKSKVKNVKREDTEKGKYKDQRDKKRVMGENKPFKHFFLDFVTSGGFKNSFDRLSFQRIYLYMAYMNLCT